MKKIPLLVFLVFILFGMFLYFRSSKSITREPRRFVPSSTVAWVPPKVDLPSATWVPPEITDYYERPTVVVQRDAAAATVINAPEKMEIQAAGGIPLDNCRKNMTEALEYMKKVSPKHYQMVETYLNVIRCVQSGSGTFVGIKPVVFQIGPTYFNSNDVRYRAQTIVHDATHEESYELYARDHPGQQVPESAYCCEVGEQRSFEAEADFLEIAGGNPDEVNYLRHDAVKRRHWELPRYW